MIKANLVTLSFSGVVNGIIGTVYGQYMFFHTVDATYRLRVIEEHEADPETGEVASWEIYNVGNKAIVYIEIAGVKYEVLDRVERRI